MKKEDGIREELEEEANVDHIAPSNLAMTSMVATPIINPAFCQKNKTLGVWQ